MARRRSRRFARRRLPGPDPLPAHRRRPAGGAGRRCPRPRSRSRSRDVQWQRPNDLRVDVVGRRSRSRSETLELSSVWDRPWFVPRGVDDSVRIFSNEFPATGRPASAGGDRTGVVPLRPDQRPHGHHRPRRIAPPARVDVTPRRSGPALIAGKMWIDSATAEVVRLTFRYLGHQSLGHAGEPTRSDSASARRLNAFANQIVSIDADLEYSLQDGRYWMPYRQVIAGRVRLPMVSDLVIPFQATTTFDDFDDQHRPAGRVRPGPARPSDATAGAAKGAPRLAPGRAARSRARLGRRRRTPAPGPRPTAGRAAATSSIARPTIRSPGSTAGRTRSRWRAILPRSSGSARRSRRWPSWPRRCPTR